MRIHQLPPSIANQIAAGEVIERPASVVKELLENALDSGATTITVDIGYGGLNQIKVSDNGEGIEAEDLPLAIAAHATSKISVLNDLYAIHSMGFRGEALASIASIAKLTISSKPALQEHAAELKTQGEQYTIAPCARSSGTTVDVIDLFYNAPVRKRFLKGEKIEFQAIESVVKRFAMSAPHLALLLRHNGTVVLNLPAATTKNAEWTRLTKLFGTAFCKDAIAIDTERSGMRLQGYISGREYQRSQSDKQWIYINKRMVKDKLILHALKQSYEGLLHPGRFSACLLYLTIDPAEVDVNVHPTKHEVRFQQPRLVHDFFTSQLQLALQTQATKSRDYASIVEQVVIEEIAEPYVPRELVKQHIIPTSKVGQWTVLNDAFVLIFKDQKPHIVDVKMAYQEWLFEEFKQQSLPLKSRPLLVAITIEKPVEYVLEPLISALTSYGMTIIDLGNQQIMVKSLPIVMPYLNVQLVFSRLFEQPAFEQEGLESVLLSSQDIQAATLSVDERAALYDWYVRVDLPSCGKVLTTEACWMLLNA